MTILNFIGGDLSLVLTHDVDLWMKGVPACIPRVELQRACAWDDHTPVEYRMIPQNSNPDDEGWAVGPTRVNPYLIWSHDFR